PSRRDAADRVHAAPLPGGDGVFKGGVNDRSSTRPASAEISLPTGSWKTILTRNTLSGPRQAEDSMPEPILFVVDNDNATLESVAAVLERRFGADYRILTDVSPASALARIEEACERGEKVALVVADLWTAVVRVVGERWSSRCQELLDLAARNSVACEFLAHDSDEGRRVLDELGHAVQLPAVIFRDQALGDPTNAEIAEMLGGHIEPDGGLYDLVIARGGPGRSRCRRLRRLGRVAHARDRVQGTGRAGG